ncbi:hypothetical protein MMC18_003866 [Xylographa bjoerkii]|nr:hypothetical protein [Xylographa bjoerkii]
MANSGKMMIIDSKYPKPHNITALALDEMRGLYGRTVPISVIVNIGPGIPNQSDMNQITRRFSWGLSSVRTNKGLVAKRAKLLDNKDVNLEKGRLVSTTLHANALPTSDSSQSEDQLLRHPQSENPSTKPLGEKHARDLERIDRTTTYGSVLDRGITVRLRMMESDIKKDIRTKLKHVYPHATPPYYHFALEEAPKGTVQNDSSAPGAVHDAAPEYVDIVQTNTAMEEVARRIPAEILVEG